MHLCNSCGKSFTRRDSLRRHERVSCRAQGDSGPSVAKQPRLDINVPNPWCSSCNMVIPERSVNAHQRTLQHRTSASIVVGQGIRKINSAFKCRIVSYRIESRNNHVDYKEFFTEIKSDVLLVLERVLSLHRAVKVNIEAFGRYVIHTKDLSDLKCFNTPNRVIEESTDLDEIYDSFRDTIISQTTEFNERDSGWAIEKIMFIEVNVNKYSPFGGSSYIKLPKEIELKKAVINVFNQDQHCFAWSVTAALHPAETRVLDISSYPHYSSILNLKGMSFPVKLKDITKFEILNEISINVYGLEETFDKSKKNKYEIVGPLHYSQKKFNKHINLLLITDDSGNSHYCWIKNLSRLVSSQISSYEHKKYFCDGCLTHFSSEMMLSRHQLHDCNHIFTTTPSDKVKIDKYGKPTPENILKFENFERQMKVPFVVYADFESILKPIDTCSPNPSQSSSNNTYFHEPYSFAYYIKCSFNNSLSKYVSYRGSDSAKAFVTSLERDLASIYHCHLKRIVPMNNLTSEEENEFRNATVCGICDKPLTENCVKVRDHCHLTGKKRYGAAHQTCNLNYKIPNFIPIIFHNMSGYDAHLFIKELCTNGSKIDVIAQTKERYISFSKNLFVETVKNNYGGMVQKFLRLRFIDSFKFLSTSLDNLSKNLTSDKFIETKKFFPDADKFNLMRQKGVFPYSFVDCFEKLNYPSLPTKNQFYNTLIEEHISDEDYERAKRVWGLFKCENIGQYSDLYLQSDVLTLCDVFENFRNICLAKYKLDPCQYFTCPGLSWDAMLKYTSVELELLTDIDMIFFFKKAIRGGISQASDRKQVANNSFLPNYNPNEPSSSLLYLDATNLYGHSMSQPLPTGEFSWLSGSEINNLDVMSVPDNNPYGYILEVDIHYPSELHDLHSDLPFLAESIIPPYTKSKIPKLIPNLNDKKRYVVHYRNLKQAIENGLMVMRTHRVMKFTQSAWLKKYVDLNTALRNEAANKFDRDLFKLIINAVFGKTMENVDNRREIHLVTHWENIRRSRGANCLIAKPSFKTCSIFTENFVAIHSDKVKVHYDKPLYIGFSILELSKTVMYDFFYGTIKKTFGDKAFLAYSDTDSLIISIKVDNVYSFIKENIEKFDTSNYKEGNAFGIPITKSVPGKMKDEFPGDPIISFYATGAKAYVVNSLGTEMKKAKGVKKYVINKHLSSNDYLRIVEDGGVVFRKMNTFMSDKHDIYTVLQNKVALSGHDDKRFIIPNTTKTLPWGHSDIEFYQTDPEDNWNFFMQAIESVGLHNIQLVL